MLLAASPGGTMANLYSHLFGGDVALNVTLTAINSVLAAFTLPVIVNLSLAHFVGDADGVGLQFGKVLQVFAIVLVPVALGMLIRRRAPELAERLHRPVKLMSVIVLVGVIIGAVVSERENVAGYLGSVGLICVLFSLINLGIGYGAPRLARIGRRQAIASSMEIGIHNSTLAITIAITLLDSSEIAVPAAVYSLVMFVTAAAVGYLISRGVPARTEATVAAHPEHTPS